MFMPAMPDPGLSEAHIPQSFSYYEIVRVSASGCCTTRICGCPPFVGFFAAMGFIMPTVGAAPKTCSMACRMVAHDS